jgi:hypothetical protein
MTGVSADELHVLSDAALAEAVELGGTMSPGGDWRMPSDAQAVAWLAELENVPAD